MNLLEKQLGLHSMARPKFCINPVNAVGNAGIHHVYSVLAFDTMKDAEDVVVSIQKLLSVVCYEDHTENMLFSNSGYHMEYGYYLPEGPYEAETRYPDGTMLIRCSMEKHPSKMLVMSPRIFKLEGYDIPRYRIEAANSPNYKLDVQILRTDELRASSEVMDILKGTGELQ